MVCSAHLSQHPQVPPHPVPDPKTLSRHVSSFILGHCEVKELLNIKHDVTCSLLLVISKYPVSICGLTPAMCTTPQSLCHHCVWQCSCSSSLPGTVRHCVGTRGKPLNPCLFNASKNGVGPNLPYLGIWFIAAEGSRCVNFPSLMRTAWYLRRPLARDPHEFNFHPSFFT